MAVNMRVFENPVNEVLNGKSYLSFLSNKSILEKRKLLSLLLRVYTDASPSDITSMKIKDLHMLRENGVVEISGNKVTMTEGGLKFIIEELYKILIIGRQDEDFLIVSIVKRKPLSSINLKRDCNEIIVNLLAKLYGNSYYV